MKTSHLRKHMPRNPHHLLDAIIGNNGLKNDAALCRILQVAPPRISKIRHGKLGVSADIILRLHEHFRIPIAELRDLMEAQG
jgi:plasmid maintenance system antidote protein VapI